VWGLAGTQRGADGRLEMAPPARNSMDFLSKVSAVSKSMFYKVSPDKDCGGHVAECPVIAPQSKPGCVCGYY
jgi:hypothetical protein